MAYFSNGTEGAMYAEEFCARCRFDGSDEGCPIWTAHLLYNYDECNNPDSILDMLIPRSKDGLSNEQCRFFTPDEQAAA